MLWQEAACPVLDFFIFYSNSEYPYCRITLASQLARKVALVDVNVALGGSLLQCHSLSF